jgi:hypothetical protein
MQLVQVIHPEDKSLGQVFRRVGLEITVKEALDELKEKRTFKIQSGGQVGWQRAAEIGARLTRIPGAEALAGPIGQVAAIAVDVAAGAAAGAAGGPAGIAAGAGYGLLKGIATAAVVAGVGALCVQGYEALRVALAPAGLAGGGSNKLLDEINAILTAFKEHYGECELRILFSLQSEMRESADIEAGYTTPVLFTKLTLYTLFAMYPEIAEFYENNPSAVNKITEYIPLGKKIMKMGGSHSKESYRSQNNGARGRSRSARPRSNATHTARRRN